MASQLAGPAADRKRGAVPRPRRRGARHRFVRNPRAIAGAAIMAVFFAVAIAAPSLAPFQPGRAPSARDPAPAGLAVPARHGQPRAGRPEPRDRRLARLARDRRPLDAGLDRARDPRGRLRGVFRRGDRRRADAPDRRRARGARVLPGGRVSRAVRAERLRADLDHRPDGVAADRAAGAGRVPDAARARLRDGRAGHGSVRRPASSSATSCRTSCR